MSTRACPRCSYLFTGESRTAPVPAKGNAKAKPEVWTATCAGGHTFVVKAARYERNAPSEYELGDEVEADG